MTVVTAKAAKAQETQPHAAITSRTLCPRSDRLGTILQSSREWIDYFPSQVYVNTYHLSITLLLATLATVPKERRASKTHLYGNRIIDCTPSSCRVRAYVQTDEKLDCKVVCQVRGAKFSASVNPQDCAKVFVHRHCEQFQIDAQCEVFLQREQMEPV
ncbi:uncharacterized protein MELLADRAFT_110884 [Melampsora larici-populina 98AG31]|uniref:Uncharacterized protein n=1 Tax=Melampsora larici-populina (strain 98AG31 / pathotype 3-4-7) TaxID=747676 RepID=F4S1B6_MELLP|nr:uncharacterized protein MELLADRAFT_110884 [Melampsora larici-populina 98AG31]EGG01589.1 hypothetical protein MELLADRAFT_110884 [Melampsora larici-populina 98AG31]